MGEIEFVQKMVQTTREYRDRVLKTIIESGLEDLSFRPSTGMSSMGWLLTHQAAVYDFSLNMLIKGQSAAKPELLQSHIPGTSGVRPHPRLDPGPESCGPRRLRATPEGLGRTLPQGRMEPLRPWLLRVGLGNRRPHLTRGDGALLVQRSGVLGLRLGVGVQVCRR